MSEKLYLALLQEIQNLYSIKIHLPSNDGGQDSKKNNYHTKAIVNKFSNAKIYLNNFIIPRSSSGRTKDSGSFNDGSNPSLGVFCFLFSHIHIFQKDFHFLPFSWRGIVNYSYVILSKAKYLKLKAYEYQLLLQF